MNEVWKDIKGYEGVYQVSNLGHVKGLSRFVNCPLNCKRLIKENTIKPELTKQGYISIKLYKNNTGKHFQVHRLIADAFIPNSENKNCINHINGIKTDNRLENLEWMTYSENNKHAYDTGLKKTRKVICIETSIMYKSMREAGKLLNIGFQDIWGCCNSHKKTAGGFHWQYAN